MRSTNRDWAAGHSAAQLCFVTAKQHRRLGQAFARQSQVIDHAGADAWTHEDNDRATRTGRSPQTFNKKDANMLETADRFHFRDIPIADAVQAVALTSGFVVYTRRTRQAHATRTAMSTLSKTLLMIFLLAGMPYVVAGQNATEVYEVAGTGSFQGQPATITGQYASEPYNALGDATVRFVGTLRSALGQADLSYEGDTNLAPYNGYLTVQGNTYKVGILDNTGGEFIIYDGTPTLGPRDELGRFVCQWRRVR
jgi:hypothetical protein